jgi:hypothetical protein
MGQDARSLLVNADRFLLASGQRNYFYEQKQFYLTEIDRLQHIYQKAYFKKREYKKQVQEKNLVLQKQAENFNKEIMFLRKKVRNI